MPETICLDDSSFSLLMKDTLESRAEYTSQWKYVKESDMGITLLELMAIMTDLQGYHADSVTEAHLLQYAQMLFAGRRAQKCAKIAFKNMETEQELPSGKRAPQAGTPIPIDGHIFEYSRMTEAGYVFIQKDTKADFREFCVTGGNKRTVRLASYQARQSAINGNLKIFELEGGAWIRNYDCGVRIAEESVEVVLKPGRFRIVYGLYDKLLATSLGVSSQTISLPYKNPLPQALRLWVGDGSTMRDVGYTLKGQSVVLGNGSDFPILPENMDIYACRLVLSDGEVRVSKKNTVKHANHAVFSFLEILQGGAPPESAESALKRFRGRGRRCAVTREDYILLASEITGLSPEDIMVDMRAGAVDIRFLAPVARLEETRRRLAVHKPLGIRLDVRSVMKTPIKLRGEIDLYEDHPANRQEAANGLATALKAYFRQCGGVPINTYLQKTLSGMDIVRRARVEALIGDYSGGGALMPEPDMEGITYV